MSITEEMEFLSLVNDYRTSVGCEVEHGPDMCSVEVTSIIFFNCGCARFTCDASVQLMEECRELANLKSQASKRDSFVAVCCGKVCITYDAAVHWKVANIKNL